MVSNQNNRQNNKVFLILLFGLSIIVIFFSFFQVRKIFKSLIYAGLEQDVHLSEYIAIPEQNVSEIYFALTEIFSDSNSFIDDSMHIKILNCTFFFEAEFEFWLDSFSNDSMQTVFALEMQVKALDFLELILNNEELFRDAFVPKESLFQFYDAFHSNYNVFLKSFNQFQIEALYKNIYSEHAKLDVERHTKLIVVSIMFTALILLTLGVIFIVLNFRATAKKEFENLKRFKTVADFTYDWEYWLNPEGKIEYISPACEKISGYSPEEFISDPMLLNTIVHPDDKASIQNHLEDVKLNIHQFHEEDFRIITKLGEEKWVSHFCRPVFDPEGNYIGKRASNRDITTRKKFELSMYHNELKFRSIFNNAANAIFIVKEDGQIIDVNSAACSLTGFLRKELLTKNTSDITSADSDDEFSKMYEMKMQSEKFLFAPYIINKQRQLIPVEINERLMVYGGEKAVLIVATDISEKVESHKNVLRAIMVTEEKERERFAKDLHDGMGALLSSVNIFLDLIRVEQDNNEERLKLIKNAKGLINDAILSTKEIANNLRPSVLSEFGLVASIKAFIDKINMSGKLKMCYDAENLENNIDLNCEISLFRIVNELINNTLKYAAASEVKIILSSTKDKIRLEYTDNGKGFVVKKVLESSEGLGITNIINRVNSLNGKILFESKANKGVKIIVNLPLDQ